LIQTSLLQISHELVLNCFCIFTVHEISYFLSHSVGRLFSRQLGDELNVEQIRQ